MVFRVSALAVLLVACGLRAEDLVNVDDVGFRAVELLAFGGSAVGGLAYSPDGYPITHDHSSRNVQIHGPGSPRVLVTMPEENFGAFLVVSPTGKEVFFAESLNPGEVVEIYAISLSGGTPYVYDAIRSVYDLTFDSEGHGFVSAHTTHSYNEILLLDRDPRKENKVIVANIEGASGPVAVDDEGNLYYGTARGDVEAPGQQLVRFSREKILAAIDGEPIDFKDGTILKSNINGFFNLRWGGGKLFYTDMDFAGKSTRGLYMMDPASGYEVSLLATFGSPEPGYLYPALLAFRPGSREFVAGAGPEGGALLVSFSDFWKVNTVAEIVPKLHFVRGRINDDVQVDMSDAIFLLVYLFRSGAVPSCLEAADVNDDTTVDLSDAVYLLEYLFRGGNEIPAPFPDPGPAD